jgi:hypothetical protein
MRPGGDGLDHQVDVDFASHVSPKCEHVSELTGAGRRMQAPVNVFCRSGQRISPRRSAYACARQGITALLEDKRRTRLEPRRHAGRIGLTTSTPRKSSSCAAVTS